MVKTQNCKNGLTQKKYENCQMLIYENGQIANVKSKRKIKVTLVISGLRSCKYYQTITIIW